MLSYVEESLAQSQYESVKAVDAKFGYPTIEVQAQLNLEEEEKGPSKDAMQIIRMLKDKDQVIAIECEGKTVMNKKIDNDSKNDFKNAQHPERQDKLANMEGRKPDSVVEEKKSKKDRKKENMTPEEIEMYEIEQLRKAEEKAAKKAKKAEEKARKKDSKNDRMAKKNAEDTVAGTNEL